MARSVTIPFFLNRCRSGAIGNYSLFFIVAAAVGRWDLHHFGPHTFDSTCLLSVSLSVAGHSWQPRHFNLRLLGPSIIMYCTYFNIKGSRRLRPFASLVLLSICCCSGLPPLNTTSNSPLRVYFFSFVAVAQASRRTAQFRTHHSE